MDLKNTEIITDRLKMRVTSKDDTHNIFIHFTPAVTRYMYPHPAKDISETEAFINGALKKVAEGRELQVTILDRKTGEFYGCAGLHGLQDEMPELGIWVKEEAHGEGYGMEAIYGLYRWAKENTSARELLYPVDRDNYRSKRIPVSLGGRCAGCETQTTADGRVLNIENYVIPL